MKRHRLSTTGAATSPALTAQAHLEPATDVGVVIITKDEAADIGHCLRSVAWAAQIVVVDSGSTDDTMTIAAAHGAQVIASAWAGFGAQKNKALMACSRPWVLSLDADERISPALHDEIEHALVNCPAGVVGFEFPRRSQFCGKWVRHSGWSPDYVLRLFRRDAGAFTNDVIHERVVVDGKILRLKNPLLHYSYRTREEVRDKTLRYAAAGALSLSQKGRKARWHSPLCHASFAFAKTFIFKLGILDGLTGLSIAIMNARVGWLKYSLLRTTKQSVSDLGLWSRLVTSLIRGRTRHDN